MAGVDAAVDVADLQVVHGGTRVFDSLTVTIARGEITGLLGPSGCGKTTLMRAIVGVQRTQGGSVTVLGQPAGCRSLRRRVAYGTQGAAVYGDLTVRQNLWYACTLLGAPTSDVERAQRQVGLGEQSDQLVSTLSDGQRSRVSLAMALVGKPELLVLDEPTVGLDPVLRTELWGLFRGLADVGVTLLISSHVMDEAIRCDRLLLMREGKIIADTTPTHLLEDTGTRNPDAAFLALIERDEGGP